MEPGREALTLSRDSISFQKPFSRRHLYRLLCLGHTKPHGPSKDVEMRIVRRRDHAREWPRSPSRGRRTRRFENARHRQAYHVASRAKAPLEELSVRHFCLLSHIRRLMYPHHGSGQAHTRQTPWIGVRALLRQIQYAHWQRERHYLPGMRWVAVAITTTTRREPMHIAFD
jgi:hypothetical protein